MLKVTTDKAGTAKVDWKRTRLRRQDWDRIFQLDAASRSVDVPLHQLELVASHWVAEAKFQVVRRSLQELARSDYAVPIPATWRQGVPFCSVSARELQFRDTLIGAGFMRKVERQWSPTKRKTTEYILPLYFDGPPQHDAVSADDFRVLGKSGADMRSVTYYGVVLDRFGEAGLEHRYGTEGRQWFEEHREQMQAIIDAARKS